MRAMVLLYIDALGVKARWAKGRIAEVKEAYSCFESFVTRGVATVQPGAVRGGVQSDAAALIFDGAADAVRAGRTMFRLAFEEASEEYRLWLRGLIVPAGEDAGQLLSDQPLGDRPELFVRHFSDAMLQAINVEQRFKGPRLLLAGDLIDQQLQDELAIPVGEQHVVPIKELTYAPGPDIVIAGPWWDVLYLVPDQLTPEAISETSQAVGRRLRWAARTTGEGSGEIQLGSQEELAQLSMLSVMWSESEAIAWSKVRRAGLLDPQGS
jgi:hypothetical protein